MFQQIQELYSPDVEAALRANPLVRACEDLAAQTRSASPSALRITAGADVQKDRVVVEISAVPLVAACREMAG